MNLGATEALKLTSFLTAVALLVQNLEFWRLRRKLESLSLRFSPRVFSGLLGLQLASLLALNVTSTTGPAAVSVLFASTLLISVHFRGRFSGGADSMGLVLLSGLSVAAWWPEHTSTALIYIGVQSTLSYLIAGAAKLWRARWRTGAALLSFFAKTSPYDVPRGFEALLGRAHFARGVSWLTILFELSLGAALFDSKWLLVWMSAAIAFHFLNFVAFGLNRFWWVWISSYPALIYLAQTL
jgi:hypothetical protein